MIDPAGYIEHTNLNPQITHKDVELLVNQAREYKFHGICVPPFWVKKARRDIGNSEEISLVTVLGFPLGYQMTEAKMEEAKLAIGEGANELDMVWNISAFKSEMIWPKIEIVKLSKLCHDSDVLLKVIIETAYLSKEEIIEACKICTDAGADFIKTSTGMGPSGAKEEDVKLIKEHIPNSVGIKASGGIKSYSQLMELVNAGAERIGTSSGIEIAHEFNDLRIGN